MRGWWRRDPFFVRYMARECTAFAVFACLALHTVTWFEIMPKTLPFVAIGGRRVPARVITRVGFAAAAATTAALIALAWWWQP